MCLENRQKTAVVSECIYYVLLSKCYLGLLVNAEVRAKCTVNSALLVLTGVAKTEYRGSHIKTSAFTLEMDSTNFRSQLFNDMHKNKCYSIAVSLSGQQRGKSD